MRRIPFLSLLLLLVCQPSWAQSHSRPTAIAALFDTLSWAAGSGPNSEANAPAAPSPQTPPTQQAVQAAPQKTAPQAAVQVQATPTTVIHNHYYYTVPQAPVMMQAPVVQQLPAQAMVTVATPVVVQQPIHRRAGPIRRAIGAAAGELAKIGWDRTLTPPAPKVVAPTVAPVFYAPVATANDAAPPAPMAPVKASAQQ